MDLYDILFLGIFLVVWFFLVTKVFPKFGVHSWATPQQNLPEGDCKKNKESKPVSDDNKLD